MVVNSLEFTPDDYHNTGGSNLKFFCEASIVMILNEGSGFIVIRRLRDLGDWVDSFKYASAPLFLRERSYSSCVTTVRETSS